MNDDWRLRVDLHGAPFRSPAQRGCWPRPDASKTISSSGALRGHGWCVSVDDGELFCYAGTASRPSPRRRAADRPAGRPEHGWKIDDRAQPLASGGRAVGAGGRAAARRRRPTRAARAGRAIAAASGPSRPSWAIPEFEVRIQCGSRAEAGELSDRLERGGRSQRPPLELCAGRRHRRGQRAGARRAPARRAARRGRGQRRSSTGGWSGRTVRAIRSRSSAASPADRPRRAPETGPSVPPAVTARAGLASARGRDTDALARRRSHQRRRRAAPSPPGAGRLRRASASVAGSPGDEHVSRRSPSTRSCRTARRWRSSPPAARSSGCACPGSTRRACSARCSTATPATSASAPTASPSRRPGATCRARWCWRRAGAPARAGSSSATCC